MPIGPIFDPHRVAEGASGAEAPDQSGAVRVLVADGRPVVRDGLQALLELAPGFEAVGAVADGDALMRAAGDLRPHVVLLDMRLPGRDTLALIGRLGREHPGLAVLLFAERASSQQAAAAVAAGANGLVLKTAPVADLFAALVDAAGGGVVIDRDLAPEAGAGSVLTSREIEVVRLLAAGLTNREISRSLFISLATVRRHVETIRRKLGTSSRAAAVGEALRRGLLD